MITRTFFKYCHDKKYTPNQLYVLFCIKHGVSCTIKKIHEEYEIRQLILCELLEDNGRTITPLGLSVLSDILKVIEKKPEMIVVNEEFAKKYLEIFPKMMLPSNKPARAPIKAIIKNLTWFLHTYPQYNEELIMRATQYYVQKYAEQDYKFMRTSQFFISKEATNRTITSTLAEFCQLILEGVDDETPNTGFSTKVI